ncbi:unnamed protein product [Urochloa decumbens]|uniref:F-box domain-containing protein n=1 Tax=Urochloa decumbens TaxID=240449 RepID=A0ABC8VWV2_9POAL
MDVSDDVLGIVLERVDSHVSLIRAAAVCKRWRRAIADASFLRRYRSLHASTVAGHYHNLLFQLVLFGVPYDGPVFVPSSPSMVDARHFSLDFLPDGAGSWILRNSRGSLLLMFREGTGGSEFDTCFPNTLVCNPLTQSYMMVPPPADFDSSCDFLGNFLIDGETDRAGGCIGMSNFRVLCMFDRNGVTHVAMFTLGSSWSEKNIDHIAPMLQSAHFLGHAWGSHYIYADGNILIKLDGSTGDFTSSMLPAIEDWDQRYDRFVAEDRDGKPCIFTVFDSTMKVFARLDSGEWALEKSVLLSEATSALPGYQPSFFHGDQGILIRGSGFVTLYPEVEVNWQYSINLQTMEAELAEGDKGRKLYRCELPWPPALHACLD